MKIMQRLWSAFDDRVGVSKVFLPIIRHPVPPTRGKTAWAYVFGSATLFSFIVAVVSGIPIAAQYIPSTGQAYQSLQWITQSAIFGAQLRGIHDFSATLMLILVGVHMCRVFLMGSYKFPREVNWLSGVLLLLLTMGIVFTGQILRWDQLGVYTIMITVFQAVRTPFIGSMLGHFLLGGDTLTGVTLSRFFALHVFILPGLLAAIIGFHLYMVLHAGISEAPKIGRPVDPRRYRAWYDDMLKREGVPFWPDVAWRDAIFGVGVITLIVVLALTVGAPALAGPPDPSNVNVIPRPDWYFLWYFGALALLPPGMENYVIIGGPLLLVVVLFALPIFANKGERNPRRRPWAVAAVACSVLLIGSLTVIGAGAPWSPQFNPQPLTSQIIGATRGPIYQGALVWQKHSCEDCHAIDGHGGVRGPDLTNVGDRLTADEMTIRILNGGENMPAFGGILTPSQVSQLVAFLRSRTASGKAHSAAAAKASR